MTSTLTDPTAAHLAHVIDHCGWAVVAVGTGHCHVFDCDGGDGDNPFAYTVGLHAMRLPDLIVRGLDGPTAQQVLNDAARQVLDGDAIQPGALVVAGGSTWTITPATPADRSDMRYARALARGSGRRLTAPLRLDEPLPAGLGARP